MWRFQLVILLVLLSIAYGRYQVHFEERQYTFSESRRICVRVRIVGDPPSEHFSISYTFDAVLIGGRAGEYDATQLFRAGDTSTKLCLPAGSGRDSRVCESDTEGTIRLINTSTITSVEPSVTTITVTDDEFVFATFNQSAYTFQEGSGTQHMTVKINNGLNKSLNLHLTPVPVLDATSPLSLVTTDLEYQPASPTAGITVALRDDDIALEEEEQLSLGILLTSSECYDFTITPTQITILDNDVVNMRFTEDMVEVNETDGEAKLCVSISHVVARPLNFAIMYDSFTPGHQQKGGSIFGQFTAHSSINVRCFTIPFIKDDIVGNDRQISAYLDINKDSYPTGVMLSTSELTVNIKDTSICHDVIIDNSTDKPFEVPPHHSVCFLCQLKEANGDISWKIGGLSLSSGK
jgi:hypothetical protein